MVAYNFQKRFADAVERGQKRQTIRARRADGRHARVGDNLQLYTGMRTKQCRKLRDTICTDVCAIRIYKDKVFTFQPQEIHVDDSLEFLAKADGFKDWFEMRDWFEKHHGLPFEGIMIRWRVPLADRR